MARAAEAGQTQTRQQALLCRFLESVRAHTEERARRERCDAEPNTDAKAQAIRKKRLDERLASRASQETLLGKLWWESRE